MWVFGWFGNEYDLLRKNEEKRKWEGKDGKKTGGKGKS